MQNKQQEINEHGHDLRGTRLLLIMTCVLVSACDQLNKVDNMNNKTTELSTTSRELLGTTNQMKGSTDQVVQQSGQMINKMDTQLAKTDGLAGQTAELYDLERQGGSVPIRKEALDDMYSAHAAGKKIAGAATYFESFEFQTFTGLNQDQVSEKRDLLILDAIKEFFMKVTEYNADVKAVSPFAMKVIESAPGFIPNSEANQQACFAALSVTMDLVNRKQVENIKNMNAANKTQLSAVSIYTLITDTLAKEKQIESGALPMTQVKAWEKVILANRDLAIKLLQTRHNIIIGVVLGPLVPEDGFWDNVVELGIATEEVAPKFARISDGVRGLVNFSINHSYSWDLDLDKMNLATIQTNSEYLQLAQDTRMFLRNRLNLKPEVDSTIQAYLNVAKVKSQQNKGAAVAAARTNFVGLFNQLKSAQ